MFKPDFVRQGFFCIAAGLLLSCAATRTAQAQAEIESVLAAAIIPDAITVYTARRILTMDAIGSSASAVAVGGQRILAVGSLDSVKAALGSKPYVVDSTFSNWVVMPGFIEQHLHPILGALTLSIPVIATEDWVLPGKTWPAAHDKAQYLAALSGIDRGMQKPDETLFTWGYHQYWHGIVRRKDLDAISATRPIVIWHRSAHEMILNTAALAKFGITRESVTGKGAASLQADWDNGHFLENGLFLLVAPKIVPELASPERLTRGLRQMVAMLHNSGVTAYMEPGAVGTPALFAFYQRILDASDIPLYSFFIADGRGGYEKAGAAGAIKSAEDAIANIPLTGKFRRLPGEVKFWVDGAIISLAMQMKDGYTDGHGGEWIMKPEEFAAAFKVFWDAGYQIHVHVNGDAGMDVLLDTLEKNLRDHPRPDHRTVIVHFANSTDAQVPRIARSGAIVSANPYYLSGFADKFGEQSLGKARADAMVRLGPVEKAGISLSLHSDLPMGPANPLYLAWCAVNRVTQSGRVARADLRISVDAAMRGITSGAAYSWRMEKDLGSIEPGKIANFTVLEEDPYAVDPLHLKDIKLWGTVFEGEKFPIAPP